MDLYNERAETGLQCIAGAMPKFLLLSGAKKRKISKEKKRKDLAVIAKTPRLNHFFPAKLPSSNFEAVTLTTASKNVGENQGISLETAFALDPASEQGTVDSHKNVYSDPSFESDEITICDAESASAPNLPLSNEVPSSTECVEQPWQSTDPANWFPISQVLVDYWMERGLEQCQNRSPSGNYPRSRRHYQPSANQPEGHHRYLTTKMLYSRWTNGEIHPRKWLLYSPSKGSVYCYYCSLLNKNGDKFSHPDGFSSWKKAHSKISAHEQSEVHRNCVLEARDHGTEAGRVDRAMESQRMESKRYWCDVLHRVVSVVRFLCERGLVWGAVCKNIISDRFSTKTAISGRDSYLCMQRCYLWQR